MFSTHDLSHGQKPELECEGVMQLFTTQNGRAWQSKSPASKYEFIQKKCIGLNGPTEKLSQNFQIRLQIINFQ